MAISGAEDTITKISSLVESQFPEFMREDGPRFVNFLKAYYEFMEQASTDNGPMPIHAARSLPDYADIDRTLDAFVENFRTQFMTSIPKNIQSDKKLLSKYIRDFYRTRGSQFSYETLFRALFDDEVLFYYPGEDILRASDGRWVKTTTAIVGPPFLGNIDDFGGREITSSSGGSATVLEVYRIQLKGVVQYVLTLDNVKGTFKDADLVTDTEGTSAEITSTSGALVQLDITDGGGLHNVGDTVTLTGQTSGAIGVGVIRATDNIDSGATVNIVDGGSGYEIGANTVFTISGGSGEGLSLEVTGLANTATANLATQTIEPAASIVLNTSGAGAGTFSGLGQNTATLTTEFASANIASALESSIQFEDITVGAISKIRITDVGSGYGTLPAVTARNQRMFDLLEASRSYYDATGPRRGDDAIFVSNVATGSAALIEITQGGSAFQKGESVSFSNRRTQVDSDTTYLDRDGKTCITTYAAHYDGAGEAVVSGVITNPGAYFDTKGFLSWDKKLQDNYYYQEYSYVLKATKRMTDYKDIVQKVLHPAGTKMFGQVEVVIPIALTPSAIFTVPQSFTVDIEESASASDSPVAGVNYATISVVTESVSPTDAVNSGTNVPVSISESVSASESQNITNIDFGGFIADSLDLNTGQSQVVTVDFAPDAAESASASEAQDITNIDFGGAITESASASDTPNSAVDRATITPENTSITATDTPDTTVVFNDPDITESASASDTSNSGVDRATITPANTSVTASDTSNSTVDFGPDVTESASASDTPDTTVVFNDPAVSESASASDSPVAGVDLSTVTPENTSVTASDSANTYISQNVSLTETLTANGTPNVENVDAGGAVSETSSVTDSVTSTVDYSYPPDAAPDIAESVDAAAVQDATVVFDTSVSESASASDQFIVEHFNLDSNYISVQYANNTIQPVSSFSLSPYQKLKVSQFTTGQGDTIAELPRFVTSVSPDDGIGSTALFQDGRIAAGANLIIIPVGGSWDGTTYYTIDTILSNSAFTLTSNFTPTTANATFSYSTAT